MIIIMFFLCQLNKKNKSTSSVQKQKQNQKEKVIQQDTKYGSASKV